MKRYSFRLADVLRVRRLQEDMARSGVLSARRAEDAAAQLTAQRESHYAGLATSGHHQSAAAFLAWRAQAGHRADAVVMARNDRREAGAATASAVDGWRTAHGRVEMLERLDERRREEHHVEVRRDEDATADELIVARRRLRGGDRL